MFVHCLNAFTSGFSDRRNCSNALRDWGSEPFLRKNVHSRLLEPWCAKEMDRGHALRFRFLESVAIVVFPGGSKGGGLILKDACKALFVGAFLLLSLLFGFTMLMIRNLCDQRSCMVISFDCFG